MLVCFDRDAEYDGWLFQRNALSTKVVDQDSLVRNFIAAAEYSLKFGTPDDPAFVRLLYRYILLREASQADIDFQVAAIRQLNASGTNGRVSIAKNFLNSEEFRSGNGPRLTAFLLSATLLLRDGTPEERKSREDRLKPPSNTPVKTLVSEILASPEFTGLLN